MRPVGMCSLWCLGVLGVVGGLVPSSASAPLSLPSATVDATLAESRRLLGSRAPARVRQARVQHAPKSPKKHLSKLSQ